MFSLQVGSLTSCVRPLIVTMAAKVASCSSRLVTTTSSVQLVWRKLISPQTVTSYSTLHTRSRQYNMHSLTQICILEPSHHLVYRFINNFLGRIGAAELPTELSSGGRLSCVIRPLMMITRSLFVCFSKHSLRR